jgi:hypothetical protein
VTRVGVGTTTKTVIWLQIIGGNSRKKTADSNAGSRSITRTS